MNATPSTPPGGLQALAIGASAGGIDALMVILASLPAETRVPIVVVLHLPAGHDSQLAEIFGARLPLQSCEAQPGEPLLPGHLYFAPADYHLLIEPDGTFSLSCEPPVHFSRPSIDLLFESGAEAFGERFAALVLTGANEDGARGLARVRECGGLALVQDPAEAAHAAMPRAALVRAGADQVLTLAELHDLLPKLICP
ncbi:chemotaxis protein CheB [Ramlibacter sp. AW1]|uniref:protein-glutamate methylesterase n=1 Tax=Ramlibacter aurantiacus TaxID=2801330 RepID=A0A937D2J6_9BURK|nr:chemotaxis protein CheB [Ramlibacter aurantiacus]MBL0421684.1 chemotaxis protein CheB [Ramlibacter aurantiacus]